MSTIVPILSTFSPKPGDGLCLFFLDPAYEFFPAGIGSSLGYCNYKGPMALNAESVGALSAATISGVRGAYVGIGFDVKGEFSTTLNGKSGDIVCSLSKNEDTHVTSLTSVKTEQIHPNTICVRLGEADGYRIASTTRNLSAYPYTTNIEKRYSETPALSLHQSVTSRNDIKFHSVRVYVQNNGSHIRIEIKPPGDTRYYPYQIIDLPYSSSVNLNGLMKCGLAFTTSNSIMNCELKNFSVQGDFSAYTKSSILATPLSQSNTVVTLVDNCP